MLQIGRPGSDLECSLGNKTCIRFETCWNRHAVIDTIPSTMFSNVAFYMILLKLVASLHPALLKNELKFEIVHINILILALTVIRVFLQSCSVDRLFLLQDLVQALLLSLELPWLCRQHVSPCESHR